MGTDTDDTSSEDEEESEGEGKNDTATKGSSVGCSREGDDVDATLLVFFPE